MSFELCKIFLQHNIDHHEKMVDIYKKQIIDFKSQKYEKMAKRKRVCKFRDIQCIDEAINECIELMNNHEKNLNKNSQELADLLRMELLIGLVPDVESKKRGTL